MLSKFTRAGLNGAQRRLKRCSWGDQGSGAIAVVTALFNYLGNPANYSKLGEL
jgi:hypothetical protein